MDGRIGELVRVLYFAYVDFARADGARRHTLEVLGALSRMGHDVYAVLVGGPCELELPPRVWATWVPAPKKTLMSLWLTYCRAAHELRKLAGTIQPDLYYEREAAFDPVLWQALRGLPVPRIIEVNGLVTEDLRLHGASWRGIWLARGLQRLKCRSASTIVCGAAGWVEWLRREHRLPAERVVFIPNGVCPEPFGCVDRMNARAQLGIQAHDFVVGFVGSFNRYMDLQTVIHGIIRANQIDRRVMGCFVGTGSLLPECEELVRKLGATNFVRFAGSVPADMVPVWMGAFDCAVAPMGREWLQQMLCWHASTKVAEYLAAGLPIVAFDLPGSASSGTMARASLTISPGDVTGFAQAVVSLIQDPQRHQRMSAAAQELARERTWEHTLERIFAAVGPLTQKAALR